MNTRDMINDAAAITLQDLHSTIFTIRYVMGEGHRPLDAHLRAYLEDVRHLETLRQRAEDADVTGLLTNYWPPIPFRTGMVGVTTEYVRSMEWKPYSKTLGV